MNKPRETPAVMHGITRLTDHDIYLFKQGRHTRLYEKMGAHAQKVKGTDGVVFAVWAPNARAVSVIGPFNDWAAGRHPLQAREDGSGIWEGFIPALTEGISYKYHIQSQHRGYAADKGDPFAFAWEEPPRTACRIQGLDYAWGDSEWMQHRATANGLAAPWSVYEMHPGSWRRIVDEGNRFPTYRELAAVLPDYLRELGHTHVELMPVTEHPFYGSWGYQTTGYFAPTARYGTPQDFMFLVDRLHQAGIGVIMDWVPSHFPDDEHGLRFFDGTYLFEHEDPKQGYQPEWQSYLFNYGRHEVRSFLISSALFWMQHYHLDGLRVDAVASMLYLNYGRQEGEWIPNTHGGHENLQAMEFLRDLNEALYRDFPDTQTIAEESTAWPMVSRPTYLGGLGFGMKWNMGWMHDTLDYFATDPLYRKYHHDKLTFSLVYAFNENFALSISHDEVVHGKGSLIGKMPGDVWQKFANLRALFGYMYGHPGKKLLFMGAELGQWREWNHDASLDWDLLEWPNHRGLRHWLGDLNHLYRHEPALFEQDFVPAGFEWIDCCDVEDSTLSFLRKARDGQVILVVCNLTPVPRRDYRVGVPRGGWWRELLNSDAEVYGGSGVGNQGGVEAAPMSAHGRSHSLLLHLPPLGVLFLKPEAPEPAEGGR